MWIISRKKIEDFCGKHPKARAALDTWYNRVKTANFKTFQDVREAFPNADKVKSLIVFNIGGNNYRLIAKLRHPKIWIRNILTHREYDRDGWKDDPWFDPEEKK